MQTVAVTDNQTEDFRDEGKATASTMNTYRPIPSKSKPTGFTLVEIMIVVLIIGILLAIAIPNFLQARDTSRARACLANLKQLENAKQQYMMDKNVSTFTSVVGTNSSSDTYGGLVALYVRSAPMCPAGGTYTSGDTNTLPTCELATSTPGTYGKTGTYPHALP